MRTYIINAYTGGWNSALDHHRPSPGDTVEISQEPDARELDDFRRVMRLLDLEFVWEYYVGKDDRDVYSINESNSTLGRH